MRPYLLCLLHLIHKCAYYSGQDIEAFVDLMDDDELELYIINRHAVLPREDKERVIEVARMFVLRA